MKTNNVSSRLSPQWLCGNSSIHALGNMTYGCTLLVPIKQRVVNKLKKEYKIRGHK